MCLKQALQSTRWVCTCTHRELKLMAACTCPRCLFGPLIPAPLSSSPLHLYPLLGGRAMPGTESRPSVRALFGARPALRQGPRVGITEEVHTAGADPSPGWLTAGKRYPLAVKLGTITPHGADVYSYAPDEASCPVHLSASIHCLLGGRS